MTKHTKQAIIISTAILLVLLIGIGAAIKHREIKWWYWWWQFNRAETMKEKDEVLEKYTNDAAVAFLIRALEKEGLLAKGEFKTGEAGAKPENEAKLLYWYFRCRTVQKADIEYKRGIVDKLKNAEAVRVLCWMLEDNDASVRSDAALALGNLDDKRAVLPLITALKDSDSTVRKCAAYALGYLGDNRAAEPLICAFKNSSADVKVSIAYAFLHFCDKRTLKPLIDNLTAPEAGLRQMSALALGELGDRTAIPPLRERLNDPDANVRRCAAVALGDLGEKDVVKQLIEVVKNGENVTIITMPQLSSCYCLKSCAASSLVQIDAKEAVGQLIDILKGTDRDARMAAAYALGNLGDRQALEQLKKALADENGKWTRNAIQEAIQNLESLPDTPSPRLRSTGGKTGSEKEE